MSRFIHRAMKMASGFRPERGVRRHRGFVMMDVVVAMAFAATVLPVAMMLLAASGDSAREIRMKSAGLWVVPLCLDAFDPADGARVFAVTDKGTVAGPVDEEDYRRGMQDVEGQRVCYLCRVAVVDSDDSDDGGRLKPVVVSLEAPAQAAQGHRSKVAFHTMMR